MDISGEAITAVAVGIGAILGAIAYAIRKVAGRSDRRLDEARSEHRQALADSDTRCREDNAKIVARLTDLEDGRHKESREDQKRLVEIIAQYGEDHRAAANITAGGNKALATAIEKLAMRMPDHTPTNGNKTT